MSTQQPRAICRLLSVAIPCCLALALSTLTHGANVWHVDINSPVCSGNGQTWPTAFTFLQDALPANNGAFMDGDIIRVAQGTYYPDVKCDLGAAIDSNAPSDSFVLPGDITLEGGYRGVDGTGNPPNERNVALFVTILSGDIMQDDNPLGPPTQSWAHIVGLNSIHVARFDTDDQEESPTGADVLVNGVTITAGNANVGGDIDIIGGGVLIDATEFGGNAIGPKFEDCTFIGNKASAAGGALVGRKIGARLRDCDFIRNRTDTIAFTPNPGGFETEGGGAVSISGGMQVVNCLFKENESAGRGGAVDGAGFGVGNTLVNCEFRNNLADTQGGGAFLSGGLIELTNCLFFKNTASGKEATHGGGGLFANATANIFNCSFADNVANAVGTSTTGGGAITSGRVANSIFWDNVATGTSDWTAQLDGADCPEYCCIKDFPVGDFSCFCQAPAGEESGCPGNINTDPLFANQAAGNLRLLDISSCCVDAGDPDDGGATGFDCPVFSGAIPCDTLDVDLDSDPDEPTPDLTSVSGSPGSRVLGCRIDIGAYEFISLPCPSDCQAVPNCSIDVPDLLALLAAWGGPQTPGTTCDLDGNGAIEVPDLLELLANWGPCRPACGTSASATLEEVIVAAGLTMDDWDEFEECMMECNEEDQENYLCWMDHYLGTCTGEICDPDPCPGADPFSGFHLGF